MNRWAILLVSLMALSLKAAPSPGPTANDYYANGIVFFNREDWTGSISNFTRAIELDANFTFAYGARGVAEMNQGIPNRNWNELEAAKIDLNHFVQLQPHATNTFRMYDYLSNIAVNQAGIDRIPDNQKDYANAAFGSLDQCLRLKPDYSPAYFHRGWLKQFVKKDPEGALADYTQAIKLDPKAQTSVGAYWLRSKLKEAKGDLTGAKQDQDKARELDPKTVAEFLNARE